MRRSISDTGAQAVRFDATNNGMGTLREMEFSGGAKTFNVENGTAATDLQITGNIAETSASSLIKTGAGALTLAGVNTYSGGTTVQAGELFAVAPSSLPGFVAGNLSVADGATLRVRAGVGLWTSDDLDDLLDDTFFVAALASGSTLGIDVAAGDPFVYANDLGFGEAGIDLLKTGAGTLDLTGGNTYTGTTEIREGVLKSGHASALGDGSNITFSGGTLAYSAASAGQDWSARFKNSTSAIALDLSDASATTTYSGVIDASNTGGLTMVVGSTAVAAKTLVLSGNNEFTGPIRLTGVGGSLWAQLRISSDENLGVAPSSPTPGSIVLDSARLLFASSMTLDANRGISVPNAPVTNRGELQVLNAGDTVIYGGKIEGYQIRHSGPGTLRLTGTESTFSGDFMLQGNAVTEIASIANIGAPSSIGSGNRIQMGVSTAGGTLRYLGSGDSSDRQIWVGFGTDPTHTAGAVVESSGTGALVLTGNLLTQAGTTATRSLTLGGSNTDDNTFSGLIADHDTGAGGIIGLVKNGTGKWIVSGNNTYSGSTTVSGGTLQISGPSQSSAVTVDSGTLLMNGTHTGGLITVNNGGVLGGGGTVRDVQFVEGSMFLFDPALTLTVEAGYEASFLGFGVYDLVNAAGASISTWGGSLGLGPYTLIAGSVDFSSGIANVGEANAAEIGGGKSAYFQEGSLQLVVIPEPGSLGMIGLLAAAALLRRRLRRG